MSGWYTGAPKRVPVAARGRAGVGVNLCQWLGADFWRFLSVTRFFLPAKFSLMAIGCMSSALVVFAQDNGSAASDSFGRGVEITVTVHDGSGEPISSSALVRLYRDGSVPSGQAEVSRGHAVLEVNSTGQYTVVVEAAGYATVQQELSVPIAGRTQLDIYLRRDGASAAAAPGRPVLAPKAKEAVERGLQAMNAGQVSAAEKYVGQAMRLAPGHPDVLYLRGVLSLKQRNWTQAQEALEKATQIDPKHARAFAALGMAFCDQGKYDAAIAPLEKSLQLEPAGAWETRWALGKAYYQGARYDEALKMSQDALAGSNGKAPEIALLLAQAMTAVGRYEDAAEELRGFLKEHAETREAATARRWLERLAESGKLGQP